MSIDNLRPFFVNPQDSESAEDLAELASLGILVMANIYASKGNPDNMNEEIYSRLEAARTSDSRLQQVAAELLAKLFKNRLFDNLFMGQIHPQGNKIGIFSQMVASFMNNNTVVKEVSPVENELEQEVLARMAQWFGYDPECFGGNITVGGSTANLEALWVSREKAYLKAGRNDVQLFVLASEMAHYSISKATEMLGSNVHYIEVETDRFKTSPKSVLKIGRELLDKYGENGRIMCVVGLAGETETGEIDDLDALGMAARELGADFHVDAAYGGPYILSDVHEKFYGIEKATSITIDPHKMLYVPYASGAVLFQDHRDLMLIEKNMKDHARYLLKNDVRIENDGAVRNFGMSRVEGSMGSGGVLTTWTTLKLMGEDGIADILNHTLELTRVAYDYLQDSSILRPLHIPTINTQLIGLKSELGLSIEEYNKVLSEVQAAADEVGEYVSYNEDIDNGRAALRMVIMHPHTTDENVKQVLNSIERLVIEKLTLRKIYVRVY